MNKKIKIIDLLNKIANGEYPKKIKYKEKEHEFNSKIQWYADYDGVYEWFISGNKLNDEVEILEDNTEEIEELDEEWTYIEGQIEKTWSKSELELVNKINEIIRYIKRKEKNND